MEFNYDSDSDNDTARNFGSLAKADGLWKSDKQAAYWLREMEHKRKLADEGRGWDEYERKKFDELGLSVPDGAEVVFASGTLRFEARHRGYGGLTHVGAKRLTWAYLFDGVGLLRTYKIRHRDGGEWFGPEVIFEREIIGQDHWVAIRQRRAEAEARRAAEYEAAEEAPSGRVTITGEVVTDPEWRDQGSDRYGRSFGAFKTIVRDDRGFKVWISEPARHSWKRGTRVKFDAALTVSDTDSKFAFGKRPTKISCDGECCG